MKQVHGWWLPDYEQELLKFLSYEPAFLRGRGSYQRGKWEKALSYCPPERRRVFVDIGAHVGLWSIPMSFHFEQVEAFEPHPLHQACFERNIDEQYATGVSLYHTALGMAEGEVTLSFEDNSSGDTHVSVPTDGVCTDAVPLSRLDQHALEAVDLIKLDCEGFELPALIGGIETITRDWPVIVVEQKPQHEHRYGFAPLAAVQFLRKLGYQLRDEQLGDYFLTRG